MQEIGESIWWFNHHVKRKILVPKKPSDPQRSNEIAREIKRLVELRQEEHFQKHGKPLSIRQIQKHLQLEHPALLNIMEGKNDLLSERSKWSLFKIGKYFGTDLGEPWLREYVMGSKRDAEVSVVGEDKVIEY
jgi:hypothetical protein